MDGVMGDEGDEEESDNILNQVLDEIGIDMMSKVSVFLAHLHDPRHRHEQAASVSRSKASALESDEVESEADAALTRRLEGLKN